MESPVRIKSALGAIIILLLIENYNCFPSHSKKHSRDDLQEQTTASNINKYTNSALNTKNNALLYQRKNTTNLYLHPTTKQMPTSETTVRNSPSSSAETTASTGNRINFRGSMKYFATRPPFKPKSHSYKTIKNNGLDKNATKVTNEDKIKKSESNTLIYKQLPFRRKNHTVENNASESSANVNVTALPDVSDEKEDRTYQTSSNDYIVPTVETKNHDRVDSGKSLNYDFNIDRYTSPEFHDVNNVYSQAVSPEVEHFIVPENVSDYFVSVGSAPYTQRFNNYYTESSKTLTTPKTDAFDRRFKEVSESIRQNLADSEYSNEDKYATEKTHEDIKATTVNFEDLIAKANNNNTKVVFKNTKEITINDSEDSKSKHKDYTNSNGTKVFYETSVVSTEGYDQKSSTSRTFSKKKNNHHREELTTLSPVASNEILHQASMRQNNITRRVDHLKTNETRKEFLATIRMRAHTTPRPRVRISLKGNRVETPTTVAANFSRRMLSTTRNPNLVKLLPYTRRRNYTYGTPASKIDPVYQVDNSPTRMSEHAKSESDNSIPLLRKRGSVKYYGTNRTHVDNSSIEEGDDDEPLPQYSTDSQLSIPPTATAWALVSMKNTPIGSRLNNNITPESNLQNQESIITKTDDDLQILDKNSDAASNTTSLYEKVPTLSIENENYTNIDYEIDHGEFTSASRLGYTTIVRPRLNVNKTINDNKVIINPAETKSPFESITKFPDTITTPLYETQNRNHSQSNVELDEDDTTDEDDNYNILLTSTLLNQLNANTTKNLAAQSRLTTTTSVKYEKVDITTVPNIMYTTEKTTTPDEDDDVIFTTTVSSRLPYDTTVTSSDFLTHKPQSQNEEIEISTMKIYSEMIENVNSRNPEFDTEYKELLEIMTNEPPVMTTIPTTTETATTSTTYIPIDIVTIPSKDVTEKTTTEASDITTDFKMNDVTTTTTVNYMFEDNFVKNATTEDLSDVEIINITTEDTNSVHTSTVESKNVSQDIEAASTVYYSAMNAKTEFVTMSSTTEDHTVSTTTTTTNKPTTQAAFIETTYSTYNSEENIDSREGKKTIVLDDDDRINNTFNIPDLTDTSDDGAELPDATVDTKQLDSNEIPNIKPVNSLPDQDNTDNDFTEFMTIETSTYQTYNKNNQADTTTVRTFVSDSNIEIIKPDISAYSPNTEDESSHGTNPPIIDGTEDYETSDGAIAAITISVIGVIALLALVGLLFVARGRRRAGGYGQRCTPVSLDSYSLDNVSVSGSTRRKARRPSKRSYGNPAYDESGATSHPMQFAALANFALDQDSIMSEFNEIPSITAKSDEVPPGCETKNRYSNVIPLPETRVMLNPIPGDDTSDYINANYVRGPKGMKNYYIACQAPLATTVNDFWRMIWEQNSRVILMLTEFMENGAEKCYEYIPPSEVSDNRRIFGDFQVTVKKRDVRDKYVISILQLKNVNARVWREVTHMWYFWPAKGVPEESNSIITFLIEARSYLKASQSAKDYDEDGHDSMVIQNGSMMNHQTNAAMEHDESPNGENDVHVYNVQKSEQKIKNGNGVMNGTDTESRKKGGPLIVHCSPGTGRTGALIACDIGIRDYEMSRTVDVPKTVYRIRRDRANAVQTKDQYIFVYKVLSEYATKLTGGILD